MGRMYILLKMLRSYTFLRLLTVRTRSFVGQFRVWERKKEVQRAITLCLMVCVEDFESYHGSTKVTWFSCILWMISDWRKFQFIWNKHVISIYKKLFLSFYCFTRTVTILYKIVNGIIVVLSKQLFYFILRFSHLLS